MKSDLLQRPFETLFEAQVRMVLTALSQCITRTKYAKSASRALKMPKLHHAH